MFLQIHVIWMSIQAKSFYHSIQVFWSWDVTGMQHGPHDCIFHPIDPAAKSAETLQEWSGEVLAVTRDENKQYCGIVGRCVLSRALDSNQGNSFLKSQFAEPLYRFYLCLLGRRSLLTVPRCASFSLYAAKHMKINSTNSGATSRCRRGSKHPACWKSLPVPNLS